MEQDQLEVVVARKDIASLARCPIDWGYVPAEGLAEILEEEWHEVARSLEVDGEAVYFYPRSLSLQIHTSLETLRSRRINIKRWIDQARNSYITRFGCLREMHYATEKEYDKHFPKRNASPADIREATKRGKYDGSCFFEGITRERLEEHLWFVLECAWEKAKSLKHDRFFVEEVMVVGAADGVDTSVVCWDISFRPAVAHAFPVLPHQVPADTEILHCNDDLEGFAKTR